MHSLPTALPSDDAIAAGAVRERAPTRCSLTIRGEVIELRPERAVWWPRRKTLLVADLHIGKEAAFRRFGVPVPEMVLAETLARLERVIHATEAERLVILGDLIHARAGMQPAVIDAFSAWRAGFAGRVELVLGNHDRLVSHLPAAWGIELRDEASLDGPFRYVHEPLGGFVHLPGTPMSSAEASDAPFQWSGHLHPTVRLAGHSIPAFVVGDAQAVLPAFTSFARGPGVHPGVPHRMFAIAHDSVVELTRSADRRDARPSTDGTSTD